MNNKFFKYFILGLIVLFFCPQKGFAQIDVVKGSFVHSSIMETGEYKHAFSLVLAKLPEDQIESTSAWIYVPLFTYDAKINLKIVTKGSLRIYTPFAITTRNSF